MCIYRCCYYTTNMDLKRKIAIIGGGPSGMFMYKRLIESGISNLEVHIFERKSYFGAGMPYSAEGANKEHITNVSDNEVPNICMSIADWVQQAPARLLDEFDIIPEKFNEYKVLPRLFFGEYLSSQFCLLKENAQEKGIATYLHVEVNVDDIKDDPDEKKVSVASAEGTKNEFDHVIICTGHNWPKTLEGKIPGYYDSPYPPLKLKKKFNHPIAIKGAALTAIDALRTLARSNGHFEGLEGGETKFCLDKDSSNFRIVLHSRNGLLPAVRFHLEDSHLGKDDLLTNEELIKHRNENGGFISLDFLFEENFKKRFLEKDPAFYKEIEDMDLEHFVEAMMHRRQKPDAFELFKYEYAEAEKSIERQQSIYWKEALAVLSFAMNYPAKYLCAEDVQRLQKVLMPLISLVIAFVPQSSCRDLMALHNAGILSLVCVGDESEVEANEEGGVTYSYTKEDGKKEKRHFETYIDCTGQPHLSFDQFPFSSLVKDDTICPARIMFRAAENGAKEIDQGNKKAGLDEYGQYYLDVPGITINDNFQVTDHNGVANNRIYIMAVPYIGGYNPDYSGIDFSESASNIIVKSLTNIKKQDLAIQTENIEE